MGVLTNIIAGGLFAALLSSGSDRAPVPKSEWNDAVGQSVQGAVRSDIEGFNRALGDCKDTLTSIKYKTEAKALEVNFNSKHQALDWQRRQIESVNVDYIEERAKQTLRG